ncbi:MAG: paraquat-inducible protein A [Planctomycetes bacterium]|nr:paraquat-inducible protein A [Planctomycetota bacterium]
MASLRPLAAPAEADLPLAACPCCGLVQRTPPVRPRQRLRCVRCATRLADPAGRRRASGRTALLALSALILYPVAILLPIMRVETFGTVSEASIWSGGLALLADGQYVVGVVVLLCSVVLPLLKLSALLVLAAGGAGMAHRARASTWHVVEWTGRWGMLDVLLVAILVALLKLGHSLQLQAGPGALAFTACVVLNLLASGSFDPHALWDEPAAPPHTAGDDEQDARAEPPDDATMPEAR